jgi:hypothetical protein
MLDAEHINVLLWAGMLPSRSQLTLAWHVDIADGVEPHPDAEPDMSGFGRPYDLFKLRPDTANRVGQMLLDYNRLAVDHRYRERGPKLVYRYRRPRDTGWSTVELLKAVQCLEYQIAEPKDWRQSEAYAFCQALEWRLINSLPGFDDADTWPITEHKVSEVTRKMAERKAAQSAARVDDSIPEEEELDPYGDERNWDWQFGDDPRIEDDDSLSENSA